MNNKFKESIKNLLFGSIRNQIITIIVLISFILSLMLALVFYSRAKAISLSQMEESYMSLAAMVSSSTVYDIQFNKKAIPELAKRMVESDKNILWVEFVDSSNSLIAGHGPLQKSIDEQGLTEKIIGKNSSSSVSTKMVSTSTGKVMAITGTIQGKMEVQQESPEFGFAPAAEAPSEKAARLGEVRILVGLNALKSLQRSYLLLGLVLLVIATLTGGAFAYAFSNYLLKSFSAPIELAKRVSEGDLTEFKGTVETKGEIGQLFSAFKLMSLQLASTIRRIRDAFSKVEVDTTAVRKQLLKTIENTNKQSEATEVVANNISSIQKSVKAVSEHMEGLAALAEEVSSSVLEMIASIDQIANSADGLTEAVNTSATTLAENGQAIKEIDASADQINKFIEDTSSAITEMETSIRQIEQNSSSTRQSVETASQEAASGVEVVEHTASTITQLQGSFMTVTQAMKNLGKRSEEIGNILGVIDEVMEQTHLLALNAAIIAAQAGEQGKAFSVVAGEIRSLAEKTSVSTREIATLIDTVQQEVTRAVDLVNSQSSLVEETVKASEATASSFRRIQKSVQPAVMMTQEINRSIQEQSKGTASVLRSIEQLRDQAHQLSRATKEQSIGSDQILKAVNKIRALSDEVKRATREQSLGSSLIRKAMDKLTSSVGSVLNLTKNQKEAALGVESSVTAFRTISKENELLIKKASEKVEVLAQRAEEAGKEIAHFKIQGQ